MEELNELAKWVVAVADEVASARSEEIRAEGALLQAAVQSIGARALAAIGTRPPIQFRDHNCDVNCYHPTEHTLMPDRAVCLSAEQAGPDRRRTSGTGGAYEGADLFVDAKGYLFKLAYSGTWTQWQNGWNAWEAKVTRYASAEAAVADGWTGAERYTARLADLLKRYLDGKAKGRAVQARERAAKLSAVAELLKR